MIEDLIKSLTYEIKELNNKLDKMNFPNKRAIQGQDSTTKFDECGVYNSEQLAHYLGIHKNHLFELRKQNIVPYKMLGKKVVYPKNLISEWLAKGEFSKINIKP